MIENRDGMPWVFDVGIIAVVECEGVPSGRFIARRGFFDGVHNDIHRPISSVNFECGTVDCDRNGRTAAKRLVIIAASSQPKIIAAEASIKPKFLIFFIALNFLMINYFEVEFGFDHIQISYIQPQS